MTWLLHRYYPRFLELDAMWIDVLLENEWDMTDIFMQSSLGILLWSDELN